MTSPRAALSVLLVATCAAGVVGCGSSDTGRDSTAAAAISQTLTNISTGGYKLTTEQAGCVGTGTIKAFGINKAVGYGLLTKDLKPVKAVTWTMNTADARTYADTFITCADPATTIKNALISVINPKTAAQQQQLNVCLDKNFTTSLMRTALAAAASGDTTDGGLTPVFAACGQLG